jgi:Holliday junction DNA helicase RuvA
MFAYIKGTLAALSESVAIIETAGVGYEIFISRRDAAELLPQQSQEVRLYTYLNIKEDSHTIFGFLTPQAKQVFLTLLDVSGIGPKLALTLLAELAPDQLIQAVLSNNIGLIVSVPGIGKKTAERMVLELKDKFKTFDLSGLSATGGSSTQVVNQQLIQDITEALTVLGYNGSDIRRMIQSFAGDLNVGHTVESAITLILRHQNRL